VNPDIDTEVNRRRYRLLQVECDRSSPDRHCIVDDLCGSVERLKMARSPPDAVDCGKKKADQRSAKSVPALRGAQPEHERLFNKITVIPLFKRQSASRASSSATVKRLDTRPDHAGNRAVAQQHHTGEHTTAAIIPSRQQLARCGGDWMPPISNARFSCPGLLQGRTTLRAFCANVESRIRQCRLGGSRLVLRR
jgi:hypothetical protein